MMHILLRNYSLYLCLLIILMNEKVLHMKIYFSLLYSKVGYYSTGRVRRLARQHTENSIHLSLISRRLHLEMGLSFFFREISVWSNEGLNIFRRGSPSCTGGLDTNLEKGICGGRFQAEYEKGAPAFETLPLSIKSTRLNTSSSGIHLLVIRVGSLTLVYR
jgi:hypothetical protein